MPKLEKFIQTITRQAGQIIAKKFGKVGVYYTKEHAADPVTVADLAANKFLVQTIKKNYPSHGIVSEEAASHQSTAEYVWYIDPLDGTFNYVHQTPWFGVCVGLARRGRLVLSAVYLPVLNQFFFAKRGSGAYLNGKRIHCARKSSLAESRGCGFSRLAKRKLDLWKKFFRAAESSPLWLYGLHSAAVNGAYAAAGYFDWYLSRDSMVWDYAANSLILTEAGCREWPGVIFWLAVVL
jgi:myo-inositol-1(or 4)-monophosphatase